MRTLNYAMLAIGAAFAGIAAPLAATANELSFNTYQPSTHGAVKATVDLGSALEKESSGTLKLAVHPGGAIASGKATLSVISDGLVDSGLVTDVYVPGDLPHTVVGSTLALDGESAWVMAGAMSEYALLNCKGCKSDLDRLRVINLGHHSTGPYKLLCSSEVRSLKDIAGKKIKAAGPWTRLVTAWKAVPVNIPFNDVYEAMQRGQIDCAVAPESALPDYSLFDIVKYVADTPMGTYHGYHSFVINKNSWQKLSDEERSLLIKHMPGFISELAATYARIDAEAKEKALKSGITYVKPEQDIIQSVEEAKKQAHQTVVADARKRGIKDAEALAERFVALVDKWKKLVGTGDVDQKQFTKLLEREIFSKVTF